MRVLAIVHQYVPVRCAGAETHLHAMLRALARRGHQVDVCLSRQTGDPYIHEGVRVWPHAGRKDVFRWLASSDLIVSHLENTTRATVLGHFNQVPVALVHHNTFHPAKEALTLPSSRADLVVVNSEWMAADLYDWFRAQGIARKSTVVVRPVADLPDYAATPGDRVTLVNMRVISAESRDRLSKGGELFRQLAERMPRTRFLGVEGAYGVQADMSGLPNVDVLGHVPHDRMRDDVYARTRVLLVPSSYESWGRVATEAICSGIPVIAHPTPGLRENLGEAGIFVDRDDTDGWVRALATLAMPGPWKAASRRAKARTAELAAGDDLDVWCGEAERVANIHRSERTLTCA